MTEAHLELLASRKTLWISAVILLAAVVVSAMSYWNGGRRLRLGVLEMLRVLIVALVLFALNEPEWVRVEPPTVKPSIAVFWDDSDSMRTRDVRPGEDTNGQPISRIDWVKQRVDPSVWKSLEDRFVVRVMPFSGAVDGAPASDGVGGPQTDISAPLAAALEQDKGLRAAIVLSDGDWNAGTTPVDVAMHYRAREIPIFTAAVGAPTALPDVEVVAVDAPKFAILSKPLQIPFTVRSTMPREIETDAVMTFDDGEVLTQAITIPAKGIFEGEFTWTPHRPGAATMKLTVPTQDGEFDPVNNERNVSIEVRDEAIKVLLVESFPRWEYRYLRNALVRDEGVDVSCLLFHPDLNAKGGGFKYIKSFPAKRELSDFDVVFLGDVGVDSKMLKTEDCELLKGLVEQQASGLILMPGLRGNQASLLTTPLADLFPVELDPSRPKGIGSPNMGRFALTESGRDSLLTKLSGDPQENSRIWEGFPGFQWHVGAVRARPGAKILVVHRDLSNEFGRYPLLVTKSYGAGKVLFMGTDNVWKWREGVEDKFHYRFWAQVARWMSYQRNMAAGRTMRLFYAPDRPEARSKVTLNANVMDTSGEPMDDATVTAIISGPSAWRQVIRMNREREGEWGLFRATFEPKTPGSYDIELICRETGESLKTAIEVHGRSSEPRGAPARPEVMDELARVSRGARFDHDGVESVLSTLRRLPPPPPDTIRRRIWADPWWGGLLVFLLGAFWIGRKLIGRF